MSEKEIKDRIKAFENEVFDGCRTLEEAIDVHKRLHAFIAEHNLTAEDLHDFAESGAGEMLAMMVS